jgi:prevent-host-death family protein
LVPWSSLSPEGGRRYAEVQNGPLLLREAAMPRIGISQFRAHASEILRDVKDNQARYVITSRNRPVGIVMPYSSREETEAEIREQALAAFFAAGEQVRQAWKSPLTPLEVLQEMRR